MYTVNLQYIYFFILEPGSCPGLESAKGLGSQLEGALLARAEIIEHQKEYNCKGLKTFLFCFISWIQDCIDNNKSSQFSFGGCWFPNELFWKLINKGNKSSICFPFRNCRGNSTIERQVYPLRIPANKWRKNDKSSLLLIRNEIKDLGRIAYCCWYSTKEASGHQGFLRGVCSMTLRQGMIEPASDEASI